MTHLVQYIIKSSPKLKKRSERGELLETTKLGPFQQQSKLPIYIQADKTKRNSRTSLWKWKKRVLDGKDEINSVECWPVDKKKSCALNWWRYLMSRNVGAIESKWIEPSIRDDLSRATILGKKKLIFGWLSNPAANSYWLAQLEFFRLENVALLDNNGPNWLGDSLEKGWLESNFLFVYSAPALEGTIGRKRVAIWSSYPICIKRTNHHHGNRAGQQFLLDWNTSPCTQQHFARPTSYWSLLRKVTAILILDVYI